MRRHLEEGQVEGLEQEQLLEDACQELGFQMALVAVRLRAMLAVDDSRQRHDHNNEQAHVCCQHKVKDAPFRTAELDLPGLQPCGDNRRVPKEVDAD